MVDLPFEIVPPIRHERRSFFRIRVACFLAVLFMACAAFPCFGQQSPDPDSQGSPSSTSAAAPAAPAPLPMPSMAGPLATAIPHEIAVGGETAEKLKVTGILSGVGWTEGNHIAGDPSTHWDVSNAQVFIQKTTGWCNSICKVVPTTCQLLGCPSLDWRYNEKRLRCIPQGYLKLVKGNASVEIGALPTLIGAEYTFSFENMNIQRGLLWNQRTPSIVVSNSVIPIRS